MPGIKDQADKIDENYARICTTYYQQTKAAMAVINQLKGDAKNRSPESTAHLEVWKKNGLTLHKKMEFGIEIWTDPHVPNIEIRFDKAANLFTAKFIADKNDKSADWAGTDGSLIVKIFEENSYDYIKTEDLMTAGSNIIDAAKFESIRNKYYPS